MIRRFRNDIVCVGDVNMDLVASVEKLPSLGSEVMINDFQIATGGVAANIAVAFAKLGLSSAIISKIGNDYFGRKLLDGLKKEHVNTQNVIMDKNPSGLAFVALTPNGQRTIFNLKGANKSLGPGDVSKHMVQDSAMVLVSGYCLFSTQQARAALRAIQLARDEEVSICLDLRLLPADKNDSSKFMAKALANVDLLTVSDECWSSLRCNHKNSESALLPSSIIIYGRENIETRIIKGTSVSRVSPFPVAARKKNLLGANDSFIAGLLHSRCLNKELEESVRFASACKAITASAPQKNLWDRFPTRRKVDDLLRRHGSGGPKSSVKIDAQPSIGTIKPS